LNAVLEDEVLDGDRASQLLEDSTLNKMFDDLEHQYIDAWRNTEAADTEGRERLFRAINVLGDIRVHLRVMADAGHLAQEHLNRLKKGNRK
jgi:hypothetical protein